MKKFLSLLVLLCAVTFSPTVSAEMKPAQLYDQNIFTLTQKLQSVGIKIWNMEYRHNKEGYPGYEANFGDNPNNKIAFLVNNDGSVAALGIITKCYGTEYLAYSNGYQAGEIWGEMLNIVGLTEKDIRKILEEYYFSVSNAGRLNPNWTNYTHTFSSYSMKARRLILTEIFFEEIRTGVYEFRIFMRAYA